MLNLYERVLDVISIVNINKSKYNNKIIEDDMFEILNSELAMDQVSNIDPKTNIILCTETSSHILHRELNGSISIKNERDISLTGNLIINNYLMSLDFWPRVKLSIPRGIHPHFEKPEDILFYNQIYEKHSATLRCEIEENIPSYIVFDDIRLTMYIDIEQIKKHVGALILRRGTPLTSIFFHPVYYVGNHSFPALNKVYWIQNTEVFKTFKDCLN